MFVAAIRRVEKAVFPIFRVKVDGSSTELAISGAGFFIDSKGTFASVAHIFDGAPPGAEFKYPGRLPNDCIAHPLPITELARDSQKDLFIGKVDLKPTGFLPLLRGVPDVGRGVCIVGYPMPNIGAAADGFDVGGVRRYPQPSFVLDHGAWTTKDGRLHEGFLVRDVGLFGMSGGPVVDTSGWATGIQAAVYDRVCTNGTQQILVQNAVVIKAESIQRLYDSVQPAKKAGGRKAA